MPETVEQPVQPAPAAEMPAPGPRLAEAPTLPNRHAGQAEQIADRGAAGRAEPISILTHGWKAYAAEQVRIGRWTEEELAHPERKLLPEMNSREIRQGIREGIITDPKAVNVMLQKDLQETRVFWNGWHAEHAAERDDAQALAADMIAAKEAELTPLLEHPNRQAAYLSEQAGRELGQDEDDELIETPAQTIKRHEEAARLFEMAARLARLAIVEQQQKQEQQEQEAASNQEAAAKAEAVRQELAALDNQTKAA
jgi:hypothetical protein